jgi:RNA polymerase sigma factor (sigma-70 family)
MTQNQNFGLSTPDCERLQKGDQRLQTKVFDKYAPSFVQITVSKWGVSLEDAEDIVSSAFATMFCKVLSNQIQPENLDGYVYTIIKHKSWEYAEKKKKEILQSTENLPDVMDDETDDEMLSLINGAFNLLGENCQKLLRAFYWDKKDHKELASAFQITEEASRQRKRECMKKLREIIKGKIRGEGDDKLVCA